MSERKTYTAFLRGINVGGNHKVPMKDLRTALESLDYTNVTTLLNSGNVIFDAPITAETDLAASLALSLEKTFGFPIPVLIRRADALLAFVNDNPFQAISTTKDTRLHVSFLKHATTADHTFPWSTADGAFQILGVKDLAAFSVLNLSVNGTPKGMEAIERLFGKEVTTRNWNTILRMATKLNPTTA